MTMDRLGDLPDEIICHIMSFLSAKEAACATTLSRRWASLFTIIPKLRFDDSVPNAEGSFEEFVHAAMALHVTDRVRSFSLKCKHVGLPEDQEDHLNRCIRFLPRYEDHISRCLRHVVVKRGVVALKIVLALEGNFSLPFEVFTCKTVRTMKLCGRGLVINALPADVFLPSLKNLNLDSVSFYDFDGRCSFQILPNASPMLEELVIDCVEWENWTWCCTVSSTTLRRLTIRRTFWGHAFLDIYDSGISFDTPVLTYLYYEDFVRTEYRVVNLNSLVEARIFLNVGFGEAWEAYHADDLNVMNLVNGIKNVEILEVDSQSIGMLYVYLTELPLFEKLLDLSVSFEGECWDGLPNLIERCPYLEGFTITDSLHAGSEEDGFICPCVSQYSFLFPVKWLVIKSCDGSLKDLEQIKLMLEKTPSLLGVHIDARLPRDKEEQLLADIVMLPRAAKYCFFEILVAAMVASLENRSICPGILAVSQPGLVLAFWGVCNGEFARSHPLRLPRYGDLLERDM